MRTTLAFAAAMLAASPALADWENTRWGSSEAEVLAAVEGSVRDPGDNDDRVWDQDQRISRSGDYHGMAARWVFFFDDDGKLSVIKIKPDDFGRCADFLRAAEADLGRPTKVQSREVSGSRFDVKHFASRDDNLAILTLMINGSRTMAPFCHITFQPYGNGTPGARN